MSAFDYNIKGGGWSVTGNMIGIAALVFALFIFVYIYMEKDNIVPIKTNDEILTQNVPSPENILGDNLCQTRVVRTERGEEFNCVQGAFEDDILIPILPDINFHLNINNTFTFEDFLGTLPDLDAIWGGFINRNFLLPDPTRGAILNLPIENTLENDFSVADRFFNNELGNTFTFPELPEWPLGNGGLRLPTVTLSGDEDEDEDEDDVATFVDEEEINQEIFDEESITPFFTDKTVAKLEGECGVYTENPQGGLQSRQNPRELTFGQQNAVFYPWNNDTYTTWYDPKLTTDFVLRSTAPFGGGHIHDHGYTREGTPEQRRDKCFYEWQISPELHFPGPNITAIRNRCETADQNRTYFGNFIPGNDHPRNQGPRTTGRMVRGLIVELDLKEPNPTWRVAPDQTRNSRTGQPWTNLYFIKSTDRLMTPIARTIGTKIVDMTQANITITRYVNNPDTIANGNRLTDSQRRAEIHSSTGLREIIATPRRFRYDRNHELAGEKHCVKVSIGLNPGLPGSGVPSSVTYEKLPYYRIENRRFGDINILTTQEDQDQNVFVQRVPLFRVKTPWELGPINTVQNFYRRFPQEQFDRLNNFHYYCFSRWLIDNSGIFIMDHLPAGHTVTNLNDLVNTDISYGIYRPGHPPRNLHRSWLSNLFDQENWENLPWSGLFSRINAETQNSLDRIDAPPSHSYLMTKGITQVKVDTNVPTEKGREVYYSIKQPGRGTYTIGKNIFTGNYTDINIEADAFEDIGILPNKVMVSYITSGTKTESEFSDVTVETIPNASTTYTPDNTVYSFSESSLNILPSKGDVLAITVSGASSSVIQYYGTSDLQNTITITCTVTRTVNGALMGGLKDSGNYHIQLSNSLLRDPTLENFAEAYSKAYFTILSARVVRHNEKLRVGTAVSDVSRGKISINLDN